MMMPSLQRIFQRLTWIGVGAGTLGWFCPALGAQVGFTILDSATEQPVPCRIHLKDGTGKPVRPKGLPVWHDHFVCPGLAELELKPGH